MELHSVKQVIVNFEFFTFQSERDGKREREIKNERQSRGRIEKERRRDTGKRRDRWTVKNEISLEVYTVHLSLENER